jgi:hypothetical protein
VPLASIRTVCRSSVAHLVSKCSIDAGTLQTAYDHIAFSIRASFMLCFMSFFSPYICMLISSTQLCLVTICCRRTGTHANQEHFGLSVAKISEDQHCVPVADL